MEHKDKGCGAQRLDLWGHKDNKLRNKNEIFGGSWLENHGGVEVEN